MGTGAQVGVQLGQKLVGLFNTNRETSNVRTAPVVAQQVVKALESVAEQRSRMMLQGLNGWLEEHASTSPLPGPIGALVGMIFKQGGMVLQQVTSTIIGFGVGTSLSSVLTPYMQELVQNAWEKNQVMEISPDAVALAVLRGTIEQPEAERRAARFGINPERLHILLENTGEPIGVQEALFLYRRGLIDNDRLRRAVRQSRVRNEWFDAVEMLRYAPLTPADAVMGAVQNHLDKDAARKKWAEGGFLPEDFDVAFENAGRPPGPQTAIDAWNRALIDEAGVDQAIRESDVKDKYIPLIKDLRYAPLTAGEVIEAAVQNHLTDSAARAAWTVAGRLPETYDVAYENTGNPPGPMETIELWRRGFFTQDEAKQALRESRLKDKYIDQFMQLFAPVPSILQLRLLVEQNSVSDEQALTWIREMGYPDAVAQSFVQAWHSTRSTATKELAQGEVRTLYTDRVIDRAAAKSMLTALGYAADDVELTLELSDVQRQRRFYESAITRIANLYIGHHLDDVEVSGALDSLNVPPSQKSDLMQLWTLERDANVRQLTEAQVIRFLKRKLITTDVAGAKLQQMGYQPDDAALLVLDAVGTGTVP